MTEQRYTLEEAARELALQQCRVHGHDFRVIDTRTPEDPAGSPINVICPRCNTYWPVSGTGVRP